MHRHLARDQRGDDVGVGGRGRPALRDARRQLVGVHQIAVVPERERVAPSVLNTGWALSHVVEPVVEYRVWPIARSPCSVVSVASLNTWLDEPEILVDEDVVAVADRDAGRLLASMLLGEESEVGQPRDVVAGRPDPEESAFLFRRFGPHETVSLPGTRARSSQPRR